MLWRCEFFERDQGKKQQERFKFFRLPTLIYRRKRGRIIHIYKILKGKNDRKMTTGLFGTICRDTRGYWCKIFSKKPRFKLRKNCFWGKTKNEWNQLINDMVSTWNGLTTWNGLYHMKWSQPHVWIISKQDWINTGHLDKKTTPSSHYEWNGQLRWADQQRREPADQNT